MVRYWAKLRGERCIATMVDTSAPYTQGQALVVGSRAYVVTRVLRDRARSHYVPCWEIWGRRVVDKGKWRARRQLG